MKYLWIALLLCSCASARARYRQQNLLLYESAVCERKSFREIEGDKIREAPTPYETEAFELTGLDENEVTERYCGPFCESFAEETYRVGPRANARELFLGGTHGASLRLDFVAGEYEKISYDANRKVQLEKGSCFFNPLPP